MVDRELLGELLATTRWLRAGFASTAPRSWDSVTAAGELAVQVGHLTQCVRRVELAEPIEVDPARPITDLGDELADVVLGALSVWTLSMAPAYDTELHRALANTLVPAVAEPTAPLPLDGNVARGSLVTELLRLVSDAGTLCEVALVDSGYRHRPGGTVPSVADAVASVLADCSALAGGARLDLCAQFRKMALSAGRFLGEPSNRSVIDRPGEFSSRDRRGSRVHKRLRAAHLSGRDLALQPGEDGAAALREHVEVLRTAGVTLPHDLVVEAGSPLTVSHTWVDSPTLIEATETAPDRVVDAVTTIVGWIRALASTDARIDTNLANFCLLDRSPVLIDVLPPLIVSRRPVPRTLFDELYDSLCFDVSVTLEALVAYTMTRLLTGGPKGWAAAGALSGIAGELLADAPHPGLAGSWFRARITLATRCAAGQAGLDELRELSASTSVLAFHRLDDAARAARVAAVEHQIACLGVELS